MRFHELSSDALMSSLRAALGDEKRLVAKVIAYLVEVETRRLHLELACSSMFEFCTRRLGLSESETFRRLTAARLVQRFPKLLDAIASDRLHLSSVVLLRDLFTEANVDSLIDAASGKTKREVQELVAGLAPKPDVATSFRKLPVRTKAPSSQTTLVGTNAMPANASTTKSMPANANAKPVVTPLSEGRYKLQLTAHAVFKDKLERAGELMSHRNPSGDIAVILERAVDVLIEKLEKEKFAKTKHPRATSRPSKDPARVVNAVRREVASRDDEQCSYRSPTGERCSERRFLEFDHRHPRALGGTGDTENIGLFCGAHNRYAAERIFGRDFMTGRIHLSRSKRAGERSSESVSSRAEHETPSALPGATGLWIDDASADGNERESARGDVVRTALLGMGFRQRETEQALASLSPDAWTRSVEDILREAIATLTG